MILMSYAEDRFELLKSFFMELVAAVCRTAVEAGAEPEAMLGTNFQNMAELASIHNLEELTPWLRRMLEHTMDAIGDQQQATGVIAVSDAVAYMHDHLDELLTRDTVAEIVCLSPSYFSRVFKQHVGEGFVQALTRMRLERAQELLIRSDLSVGEISVRCGFSDQGYFTKVFHRRLGETPQGYRRRDGGRSA